MRYPHLFAGDRIKKLSRFLVKDKFIKGLQMAMPGIRHATADRVRAIRGETRVKKQAMLEQARYNGEAVAAISACRFIR
jgi:hypothetical protein